MFNLLPSSTRPSLVAQHTNTWLIPTKGIWIWIFFYYLMCRRLQLLNRLLLLKRQNRPWPYRSSRGNLKENFFTFFTQFCKNRLHHDAPPAKLCHCCWFSLVTEFSYFLVHQIIYEIWDISIFQLINATHPLHAHISHSHMLRMHPSDDIIQRSHDSLLILTDVWGNSECTELHDLRCFSSLFPNGCFRWNTHFSHKN